MNTINNKHKEKKKYYYFFRVNFKKNEKTYDAEKSAVFKVLQEEQNDPEPGNENNIYLKNNMYFLYRCRRYFSYKSLSSNR